MDTSFREISEEEKASLARSASVLEKHKSELEKAISSIYVSMAFENQYTLHPRRLQQLGQEELTFIVSYLKHFKMKEAEERGKALKKEGLGIQCVLAATGHVTNFLMSQLHADINSAALAKAMNRYFHAFIAGYIDALISETLSNQEQIRKALSTALDSQRRELLIKNHAIETSINGVVLTELDGKITYTNPSFRRMWGDMDSEELSGTPIGELLGSGTADKLIGELERGEGWHNDTTGHRKNGSTFDVEITASKIRDQEDNPIGIMATFVDVTQRKHLEAQFRQSQKMEALGQLAGGIVHDFNNLLTAVSGFTQLALMDVSPEGKQYQDFMQIKIATDRGKGLTDQLRYFTRETKGEKQPLNLNKIIEETALLLKRTFPKEVTIRHRLEPKLRMISADASQMSQLLMNLCVNARDAMMSENLYREAKPPNGFLIIESRNVELDAYAASRYMNAAPVDYVCVSVSDNGTGMSTDVIDRLFEPFYTTKDEGNGIGLGLAVVYGIVQNHGGFLDVRSQVGKGSTFEIYLPAQEAEETQKSAELKTKELAKGHGNVLVVEDEPQVRQMAVRTLQRCGYSVTTAENGLHAISLYESNKKDIDLIILDMVMPKMGGRECFRRLKKIDPKVKVLCITGYTAEGSYSDLIKEGVLGILEKPLDLYEFAEAAKKAIS